MADGERISRLREAVCRANLDLVDKGLVIDTFGNVSGIDRELGLIAIKPSGVGYDSLTPQAMVVLDLEGNKVDGDLNPSSDTKTHVRLYREFPEIGGVVHTHSRSATAWAQAKRPLPCLGTTHADYFRGDVPVTRPMTEAEVVSDYERNTGLVIVETIRTLDLSPVEVSAALVANHGPFVWSDDPMRAVEVARVLEFLAGVNLSARMLNPAEPAPDRFLIDKHFLRKHGAQAYYGQK